MNWTAAIIASAISAGVTAGGYLASDQGLGLPGKLEEPASVRAESVAGKGRHRGAMGYFGRRHRRHHHGGFHGGK